MINWDNAHDIEICTDCTMIIANGEGPDDVADALAKRWPMTEWLIALTGGGEDSEPRFSMADCDGCGSPLGGDRHRATAIEDRRS